MCTHTETESGYGVALIQHLSVSVLADRSHWPRVAGGAVEAQEVGGFAPGHRQGPGPGPRFSRCCSLPRSPLVLLAVWFPALTRPGARTQEQSGPQGEQAKAGVQRSGQGTGAGDSGFRRTSQRATGMAFRSRLDVLCTLPGLEPGKG